MSPYIEAVEERLAFVQDVESKLKMLSGKVELYASREAGPRTTSLTVCS